MCDSELKTEGQDEKVVNSYMLRVKAIRFAENASNWREVCKFMGDTNLYEGEEYADAPKFLDVSVPRFNSENEITPGEWLIAYEDESYEVMSDAAFRIMFGYSSALTTDRKDRVAQDLYLKVTDDLRRFRGRITFSQIEEALHRNGLKIVDA
jgi:hypothetical protein